MHYTSWDRTDRKTPKLLVEEGPEVIGEFSEQSAQVDGDFWRLSADQKLGASATASDDRVFRISGSLTSDKRLEASLDGRTFTFINESSNNWIIEDAKEEKIAQFSGENNGVRKAILELEGDLPGGSVSREEVAALAWFARLLLENRLNRTSLSLIVTLVAASAVAVVAFLI